MKKEHIYPILIRKAAQKFDYMYESLDTHPCNH